MSLARSKQVLADSSFRWLTLMSSCCYVHVTADACMHRMIFSPVTQHQLHEKHKRCLRMDNANVSRPIQKYRERRVQDLVDLKFHYLTLLSRCQICVGLGWCLLPLAMLLPLSADNVVYGSPIYRHRCHLDDAHTPHVMCACLLKYYIQLSKIAC